MTVLPGRRALLVEDESLIAMLAEDMLIDLGCEVLTAMRIDQAIAYAKNERFDFAILDVNLGDTRSYPVADVLFERCTPFLFATGYGRQGLEPAYRTVPVLQKPYQADPLEHMLTQLLTCDAHLTARAPNPSPACRCRPADVDEQRFRADTVR